MSEPHGHKHWGCPECGNIVHDEKGEYAEGDACPKCFTGQLAEVHPMPSIEEQVKQFQAAMFNPMREIEAEREEIRGRQHAEIMEAYGKSFEVGERSAVALERIAKALEAIASAVTVDDVVTRRPTEAASGATAGDETHAD